MVRCVMMDPAPLPQVVLRDMASIHAMFLDQQEWLSSREWLERMTSDKMIKMSPLLHELLRHAHHQFPETWTSTRLGRG